MKRNIKAINLINAIRDHGIIVGYEAAGNLCGEKDAIGRDWGQVASLLDYACFVSGLPLISLSKVLTRDGSYNDKAFVDVYAPHREKILAVSKAYTFTDSDYNKVISQLSRMDGESPNRLWTEVSDRERRQPGYIAYNLHRSIK